MTNVHFYQYRGRDLVANKQLGTPVLSMQGTIKESINLASLTLTFTYNSTLTHVNYCYIPELDRYYYCGSPTITGDVVSIPLTLDVRKTYCNFIGNCEAHVIRSANNGDDRIHDDFCTFYPTYSTFSRKFGNGFTRDDKYIITIGG